MLLFKRKILKFGNFEYEISDISGSNFKIIRQRNGNGFKYLSQGLSNNFEILMNKKFILSDYLEGDSRSICGYYNTSLGYQGNIYYCLKKGSWFLKNFFYWSINYGDKYYKIYEIGRKSEGTFYCIYVDNELVSMIKKDAKMVYNATEYEIFSLSNVPTELLMIINLFIDLIRYYPNPKNHHTILTQYRTTLQKELKDKYDANFIPMIKEKYDINN